MIIVNCPTCEKEVIWSANSEFRPFCSKRCQIIDLGDWASEKNRIATSEKAAMLADSERHSSLD